MKWRDFKFGELAEIQPAVKLERGNIYPFIAMEMLEPKSRDITRSETRIWDGGGGSRFKNGDTIFARITPCLEHGKTAQISGLSEEVGFGSTEFLVFRNRPGISDPTFIYYLACSNIIREPAIKSMIGASGRQRAQRAVIEEIPLRVPALPIQQEIASVLSAYDDLIANNHRRIHLLEESARLLYKEWFVYLRFPGHEHVKINDGVPAGWEKKTAFDVMEILSGGTPKTAIADYWAGNILFFTPKDASKTIYVYKTEKRLTELGLKHCNSKLYPKDTIFITARGTVGNLNLAQVPMAMNQSCYALVARAPLTQYYLYFALSAIIEELKNRAVGSVFDAVIRDTFKLIPMTIPKKKLISDFTDTISPILGQVSNLLIQNSKLREACDLLLPRLMNGEIAV